MNWGNKTLDSMAVKVNYAPRKHSAMTPEQREATNRARRATSLDALFAAQLERVRANLDGYGRARRNTGPCEDERKIKHQIAAGELEFENRQ